MIHWHELMGQFEKKATTKSKIFGYTLASIIFSELIVVLIGTFETFSWDFIEPVSYLMGSFNFCAAFAWYCKFINKPELQSPIYWYKYRSIAKMQKKAGFSDIELKKLMREIEDLNEKI